LAVIDGLISLRMLSGCLALAMGECQDGFRVFPFEMQAPDYDDFDGFRQKS
jgi:hypothetical protein